MYIVVFEIVFLLYSSNVCFSTANILDQLAEQKVESYQRCELDRDCRENSFCFRNDNGQLGYCKCEDDFLMLSRNRTYYACLKVVSSGEECVQDNQCYEYMGTLAICDSTCQCPDGTHLYDDGKCYESIKLKEICKQDANCLLKDGSHGYCVRGRCSCNLGETPGQDNVTCIKAKYIGQRCDSDEQCGGIKNSNCREVCRCAMGFVISKDKSRCLQAARYFGDPCEIDEQAQCTENLISSVCVDGNCTCLEGHHGFGSRCVMSAKLGEPCTGMEQCIPETKFENIVNCIDGKCQCLPGAYDEKFGCNSSSHFSKTIFIILVFFVFTLF